MAIESWSLVFGALHVCAQHLPFRMAHWVSGHSGDGHFFLQVCFGESGQNLVFGGALHVYSQHIPFRMAHCAPGHLGDLHFFLHICFGESEQKFVLGLFLRLRVPLRLPRRRLADRPRRRLFPPGKSGLGFRERRRAAPRRRLRLASGGARVVIIVVVVVVVVGGIVTVVVVVVGKVVVASLGPAHGQYLATATLLPGQRRQGSALCKPIPSKLDVPYDQ